MENSYLDKKDFIFYKKKDNSKMELLRYCGTEKQAENILAKMYIDELNKNPQLKNGYTFQIEGFVIEVKDNFHEVLHYAEDSDFTLDGETFYFIEDPYLEDESILPPEDY